MPSIVKRTPEELDQLYQGLRSISRDSFPRKCPMCAKVFASEEDFLGGETRPVYDGSGLRQTLDERDWPMVEVFRNCTCGSTMLELFRERRDRSSAGKRQRKKFGQLLALLMSVGIDESVGRRELLRVLRGEKSEILLRHGFRSRIASTDPGVSRTPMAHKIIVIDDDLSLLHLLKKSLSAKLFKVDTIAEFEKAQELIIQNAYSVAIVDLGLSHPDHTGGLDIVKFIRKRQPKTKILVYTANDNPQMKAIALRGGADIFLVKPAPLNEMSSCVMGLCAVIPARVPPIISGQREDNRPAF
ncbi:MAG TPA: response regulator [Myxococcota bacterium]|nr:response regulator [Myxococcota bacterium]